MRVPKGIYADRSQHFGHRFAAKLLRARDGLRLRADAVSG
jgi:hypothetical protein